MNGQKLGVRKYQKCKKILKSVTGGTPFAFVLLMFVQKLQFVRRALTASLLAMCATAVSAAPMLQLDINNGTYVGGNERSTITNEGQFILYALGNTRRNRFDSDDVFHVSIALTPQTGPLPNGDNPDHGTFTVSYEGYNA